MSTMTHAELVAAATERFGPNPLHWAFVCPHCRDVATPADFIPHGDPGKAGQECIGRTLAATAERAQARQQSFDTGDRGCNWTAYGLIPGPVQITMEDGKTIDAFELAPAERHGPPLF